MCEIINKNIHIPDLDIVEVLQSVFDPDIHFSVYDIGLIYKVVIDESNIFVTMTLTSVNCPEAQSLPEDIKFALRSKAV